MIRQAVSSGTASDSPTLFDLYSHLQQIRNTYSKPIFNGQHPKQRQCLLLMAFSVSESISKITRHY